jgi:photosystem II stability/assembly factor-like uncharacterized protein
MGSWQNITPPGSYPNAVNGTVGAAIIVDPHMPNRVWLGTGNENNEIWRSDDCGGSWIRVNTGLGDVGIGAQWSMMVDPIQPDVLYAVSGYGAYSLWKSTDGGVNWTDILVGTEYEKHAEYRFVNNVSMDADNPQHLLVTTHGSCSEPYGPSCMAETFDGGKTWRTLVSPEGFFEGGGVVIVSGGTWVWCGHKLLVTEDSGLTWPPDRLPGGGSCEAEYTIAPLTRATNGKYYLGSRDGVLRSTDGKHWERIPGTSGWMVMTAKGSSKIFASNQWRPSIRMASLTADEQWQDLPTPPQIAGFPDGGGIPFLAYDDVHKILYASMFVGGVARMRIE